MIRILKHVAAITLLILISFICVAAWLVMSSDRVKMEHVDKDSSTAFTDSQSTSVGRLANGLSREFSGQSGFLVINQGRQAYSQRARLASLAEKSIDAQYYIWNSDRSGRLLAWHMLQAADRGVRVRILLDDFNVGDRDVPLAAMDSHRNIEVRIYNPARTGFRAGLSKSFGFLNEFKRLNRRMHNKTYVVDGGVGIVGGRNIGDEYFDLNNQINFRDRDVLAIGPIVRDISGNFDTFWNSDLAIPIHAIAERPPETLEIQELFEKLRRYAADPVNDELRYDENMSANTRMTALQDNLIWAEAELVYDNPASSAKATDGDTAQRVAARLGETVRNAKSEIIIESAYFVLGNPELDLLKALKDRSVKVLALTNSLSSNDVITNHAAYARSREDMLEHGIELYELRPDAESCHRLVATDGLCGQQHEFSLHSKSMVVDKKVVYVGSFNVNLRSKYFNSETALIIHSPKLSLILAADIKENTLPENSWHVSLDDDGDIQWVTLRDGEQVISENEPETGYLQRFKSELFSKLPLEKYF